MPSRATDAKLPIPSAAADQVVSYVRRQIEDGALKPGSRLPPERDLAAQIGVSRPSVRTGLRALAAMGVVEARQGSGTYITEGPPALDGKALRMIAALHGLGRDEMFEARRVLEVGAAGLAAERATPEQLAAIADEVMEMLSSLDEPQTFLVHDMRFHRLVADASANPVLAALVDMVSRSYYQLRRQTAERAFDLKEAAAYHRRIYEALRDHDGERAKREMDEHLATALDRQRAEDAADRSRAAADNPERDGENPA